MDAEEKVETGRSGKNPLDTAFGPHSRRAEALRTNAQGGILEIHESALEHLMLSTIGKLARVAERHPEALKYFPPGSRLMLSAEGDRGDYTDPGYLNLYCELRFPGANGKMKGSGKEEIWRRSDGRGSAEAALERFLRSLEEKSLDSDGGER